MPEPFEIHAEIDEGFTLGSPPRPWRGLRVKYRALGSRGRWRSFLLEADEQPTLAQLQEVCAKHEAMGRA